MPIYSKENLILGSGSPRRREILSLAGIDFKVLVSDVDESFTSDIAIDKVPEMLSLRKAKAIQQLLDQKGIPVLTSDTIVAVDGEILGKPQNREEAIEMLQSLSGRQHRVLTGVAYVCDDFEYTFKDITWVTFAEMPMEAIEFYVDQFQPFDKAGAYAIQEWIGVRFIEKIDGCYYNVMGLPMPKIRKEFNW